MIGKQRLLSKNCVAYIGQPKYIFNIIILVMLSAAGTPSSDPWVIVPRERIRYEEQFRSIKPSNGIITGDQAKGFYLQSQLPPLVLGQIW